MGCIIRITIMTALAITISCLLFAAALALLPKRLILAPTCAFVALTVLSFANTSKGYPLLPINNTILVGWLCMTIVVMTATLLQPLTLRRSSRGMGYIITGSVAGMAIGLLGTTFASQVSLLYGIMIVATVAGTFFGFLLYTNTPEGRPVAPGTGHFFKYLLAKGFPTAITVMQIGVVLVLLIAMYNYK